jgi:predicted N-acetyltransferase YhbS
MTHRTGTARGTGAPPGPGTPVTAPEGSATVSDDGSFASRHPGHLARVAANVRQYLTGWGEDLRQEGLTDLYRSGLPQPQFNGVVRLRDADAAGQAVPAAEELFRGLPWWWWVGPDSPERVAEALTRHGLTEFGSVPVMIRPLEEVPYVPEADGIRIVPVPVEDRALLGATVRTYSRSMGVVPGIEPDLERIEAGRTDNADVDRFAALDAGGRVVGNATLISAHGVAGVYTVHVAEGHRRRGIGGALTLTALAAGHARGMRLAALLASDMGEPLYRRLGFAPVSRYRLFALREPGTEH